MSALERHEDYGQQALDEFQVHSDPIRQFSLWLAEADQAGIFEPNAFGSKIPAWSASASQSENWRIGSE